MKKRNRSVFQRFLCVVMMLVLVMGMSIGAKAAQGIELVLSASVTGDNAQMVEGMLNDSAITIDAGAEGDAALFNLKVAIAGSELFRALLEATEEKLAFSFPGISESRYEIGMQKVQELFGEILQQSGMSSFTLPGEGGELPFNLPDISEEEYAQTFMPYIQYLGEYISERIQLEEDAAIELPRLGTEVTGQKAVFEPSEEDLITLFNDLGDMLEQDTALQGIVEKWAQTLSEMSSLTGAVSSGADPQEIVSEIHNAMQELPQALHEAADEIEEYGMDGTVLRLTVGVAGDIPCLFALSASHTEGDETETYEFGLEIDPGAASGTAVCLYVDSPEQDVSVMFTAEPDETVSKGTLSVNMNHVPIAIVNYNWSKGSSTLLGVPEGSCTINVVGMTGEFTSQNLAEGGSDYILSVNGLEGVAGNIGISGASLKLHADQTAELEAPSGEVVDITNYTEEELGQVFGELGQKIAGTFASVFGG